MSTRLKRILGRPALHVLLAIALLFMFLTPLMKWSTPSGTVVWMYCTWAATIALIAFVSHGSEPREDNENS